LDLPELEIPVEPEKPSTPKEVPSKPVDAPKTKEVEITEVVYKNDSETSEVANTPVYRGTLPNTGEKEGIMSTLGLVVIAAGITALTLGFKKYNESEDN
jgi:LPXTG-motif cell wall-anchored protein